jgi:hypothetical protein
VTAATAKLDCSPHVDRRTVAPLSYDRKPASELRDRLSQRITVTGGEEALVADFKEQDDTGVVRCFPQLRGCLDNVIEKNRLCAKIYSRIPIR